MSDRLIRLWHKRLLPTEATAGLALVEGRAHALVEGNIFPFLNGLAHFVPSNRLADVTAKLQELEGEFWKAKEEFIERYGALRESAAKEWQAMAKKLVDDPERLVATIEASFPTINQMDRFFGFDIQLFQIAAPERLGLDMLSLGARKSSSRHGNGPHRRPRRESAAMPRRLWPIAWRRFASRPPPSARKCWRASTVARRASIRRSLIAWSNSSSSLNR